MTFERQSIRRLLCDTPIVWAEIWVAVFALAEGLAMVLPIGYEMPGILNDRLLGMSLVFAVCFGFLGAWVLVRCFIYRWRVGFVYLLAVWSIATLWALQFALFASCESALLSGGTGLHLLTQFAMAFFISVRATWRDVVLNVRD